MRLQEIQEIRERLEKYKYVTNTKFEFNSEEFVSGHVDFHDHAKSDIDYLINRIEEHETMWRDLKSDAEITKDWRLYRVCRVALKEE